jgi:predicted AAA+ superfamily ATPase
MHFRRQGLAPEYYVTKKGAEVDFVLAAEDRSECRLIQVCWDIHDPVTQKREVSALLSAMQELGLSRGTIVTWLDEDVSDKRLDIVPAWKWLLTE